MLEVFKLSTITNFVIGWQTQIAPQGILNVLDQTSHIPVAHIHTNVDETACLLPGNHHRTFGWFHIGDLVQSYILTCGSIYGKRRKIQILSITLIEPYHEIKFALFL